LKKVVCHNGECALAGLGQDRKRYDFLVGLKSAPPRVTQD
jgi:hypothetical protein